MRGVTESAVRDIYKHIDNVSSCLFYRLSCADLSKQIILSSYPRMFSNKFEANHDCFLLLLIA